MKAFEQLKTYLNKLRKLNYLIAIVAYDLDTTTPPKAIEEESDLLLDYINEYASLSRDSNFIAVAKQTMEEEKENPKIQKLCRTLLDESEFLAKIDPKQYEEWEAAYQASNHAWRKAKEQKDFSLYLPYWKKAIEARRQWASLRKDESMNTLYDACLDAYEKGTREGDIDAIFSRLKEFLLANLPIVQLKQGKKPVILSHGKHDQEDLSYDVLDLIGYDLGQGALRESEHPFSNNLSRHDCRITTHYHEDDWRSNLFSVIHEGGHAIEFQNWSDDMFDHYVDGLATAAVCETHSRLFENLLGRSKAFVHALLPLCKKHLKGEFEFMSEEEFYYAINYVEPSLIRTESDEFTYSIHIIIRYEIERDLINGKIECEDVPAIWNAKYKEYLGVEPSDDSEGVMQDVHWSDGSIGYFPSYALGNLYGAQILHKMKQDIDVDQFVREGKFDQIILWLKEKDFAYDWMDPNIYLKKVTGEELKVDYFLDYLREKYLK